MNTTSKTSRLARVHSRHVGVAILLALALLAAIGPLLSTTDPAAMTGESLLPPGEGHPFGTDELGRDLFAGVAHAGRHSLAVGVLAALTSAMLGLIVGGVSGLRGGHVDLALMRSTDFVQALPRFFLVVVVVSLFGSRFWLIVLILGLTAWPATARIFRTQVMAVLGRDFSLAARAAGARDRTILLRHALPIALPVVSAQVSYQAGGAILAEAGLSFLGLGDPGVRTWGAMLGAAQHFVRDAWWMSAFPGLAITLTVLSCNLLADSLSAQEGPGPPIAGSDRPLPERQEPPAQR